MSYKQEKTRMSVEKKMALTMALYLCILLPGNLTMNMPKSSHGA